MCCDTDRTRLLFGDLLSLRMANVWEKRGLYIMMKNSSYERSSASFQGITEFSYKQQGATGSVNVKVLTGSGVTHKGSHFYSTNWSQRALQSDERREGVPRGKLLRFPGATRCPTSRAAGQTWRVRRHSTAPHAGRQPHVVCTVPPPRKSLLHLKGHSCHRRHGNTAQAQLPCSGQLTRPLSHFGSALPIGLNFRTDRPTSQNAWV